jgi:hypothetical protein
MRPLARCLAPHHFVGVAAGRCLLSGPSPRVPRPSRTPCFCPRNVDIHSRVGCKDSRLVEPLENRRLRSCDFESRTLRHLFPFVCNGDWAVGVRSPDFAGFLRVVSGSSLLHLLRPVLPCPAKLFRLSGEAHHSTSPKSDDLERRSPSSVSRANLGDRVVGMGAQQFDGRRCGRNALKPSQGSGARTPTAACGVFRDQSQNRGATDCPAPAAPCRPGLLVRRACK